MQVTCSLLLQNECSACCAVWWSFRAFGGWPMSCALHHPPVVFTKGFPSVARAALHPCIAPCRSSRRQQHAAVTAVAQPQPEAAQLRGRTQLASGQAAQRSLSPRTDLQSSGRGPLAPSASAVAEPPAMSDEKRVGTLARLLLHILIARYRAAVWDVIKCVKLKCVKLVVLRLCLTAQTSGSTFNITETGAVHTLTQRGPGLGSWW